MDLSVNQLLAQSSVNSQFGVLNWTVFLLYLLALAICGAYFRSKGKGTNEYFLGGKNIPWWAAGLSIYATHQSAFTFMAIPAKSYASNWAMYLGYLTIPPAAILAAYLFVPAFYKEGVFTCYEYLEKKFDKTVRVMVAGLFVVLKLASLGLYLYLPSMAMSVVAGVDIYVAIVLTGGVVTLYTAIGGMKSVIWTDLIQVWLMTGGALMCIGWICYQNGGVTETFAPAWEQGKFTMLQLDDGSLSLVTWSILLGGFITSMHSFSAEQTVVQRYFVTSDSKQALKSSWLNAVFLIPAASLPFLLGTCLWSFQQAKGSIQQTDYLVPRFVLANLPDGLAGLAIAGLMAAAMSSLDSSINSIVTVFWNDLTPSKNKKNTEKNVGAYQVFSLILGLIGIAVAVSVASFPIKSLFDLFVQLLGWFSGVIFSVFFLAILVRKQNPWIGKTALLAGVVANLVAYFVFQIETKSYQLAIVGFLAGIIGGVICSFFVDDRKSASVAT